jgi:DNA-binding NarL/FixJ family response regulator
VEKINVAVLDDHQSIIDGYVYRLSQYPEILVTGSLNYGDELIPFLNTHPIDVFVMDVSVPTGSKNPNPYPILFTLPKIIEDFPDLGILVISMHTQPSIIHAVLEAGALGYIVKDDRAAIARLGEVIISVANGNPYLSAQVEEIYINQAYPRESLNYQQLKLLSLCASEPGWTNNLLANKLGMAPSTVRNMFSGIFQHLDVRTRGAAINKARKMGLITPDEPGI